MISSLPHWLPVTFGIYSGSILVCAWRYFHTFPRSMFWCFRGWCLAEFVLEVGRTMDPILLTATAHVQPFSDLDLYIFVLIDFDSHLEHCGSILILFWQVGAIVYDCWCNSRKSMFQSPNFHFLILQLSYIGWFKVSFTTFYFLTAPSSICSSFCNFQRK